MNLLKNSFKKKVIASIFIAVAVFVLIKLKDITGFLSVENFEVTKGFLSAYIGIILIAVIVLIIYWTYEEN